MTTEDEEFNRIEMESRIKQEYIRAMRKTTREEKISRPAVYEVPAEGVQFMSISVDDYLKLSDDLAMARMLIRELSDRLSKLEKPWVGLTDDEQQQAYEQWQNDGWGVFYNAIEAKLKEKNNGS
jgi:hypothetical protein